MTSVLGIETLFLAAKILSSVILIQMGGVVPILAATLLLINAVFSMALVFTSAVTAKKGDKTE